MRVLVVGGGGREHALTWALHRDSPDAGLFAAPGNPGTALLGTNLPIEATAVDELVAAVLQHDIDVTIIGPEAPLAAGLTDRLRAESRAVFGPSQAAARLESSKAYAKEVMRRAAVPTGASATFTALDSALAYIATHGEPLVVKASGLAAGKGVVVCASRAEAADVARAMLAGHALGEAGSEIVVEEFLAGEELSVLALTDGERIVILPPAQDHKRLGDGDTGPNTGGMGAYCPVALTTPALLERVRRDVFEPVLREMAAQGAPYEGVLYAGLMVAADGTPNVLEFNCRFGDPEAQAILPVLAKGATKHLLDIARRRWRPKRQVLAAARAAVTTVLAARGYPEKPERGAAIKIPDALGSDVLIFHAGTARDPGGGGGGGGRARSKRRVGASSVSPASARACRPPQKPAPRRANGSRSKARPGGATSPGASSSVPELPEVETIVRELAPRLEGSRIAQVRLRKTDVLRQLSKSRLIKTLTGNTIEQVSRRAKHAVFRLSSEHRMIIQPRMTGSFLVHEQPLTRAQRKYAVLLCTLSDGRVLVYRDVRRLGTIWLLDEDGWIAYTGRIGPEPLEETFTPLVFADRLKGTRTAVKKAIMDQRRVAGVGNIYANEALFDARLNPAKPTDTLSLEEFARLHAAIVDVLQRALASSGTTLRDYRTGTGEPGRFQFELRVYGRGGKTCVRCGKRLTATHKIDLRATTFCPSCQR